MAVDPQLSEVFGTHVEMGRDLAEFLALATNDLTAGETDFVVERAHRQACADIRSNLARYGAVEDLIKLCCDAFSASLEKRFAEMKSAATMGGTA